MGIKKIIYNLRTLGLREFMKRWKQGIEGITPLQQTRTQLIGQVIILFGIVIGILKILSTEMRWLLIILVGSLVVSVVALIGTLQKHWRFQQVELIKQEGGL